MSLTSCSNFAPTRFNVLSNTCDRLVCSLDSKLARSGFTVYQLVYVLTAGYYALSLHFHIFLLSHAGSLNLGTLACIIVASIQDFLFFANESIIHQCQFCIFLQCRRRLWFRSVQCLSCFQVSQHSLDLPVLSLILQFCYVVSKTVSIFIETCFKILNVYAVFCIALCILSISEPKFCVSPKVHSPTILFHHMSL